MRNTRRFILLFALIFVLCKTEAFTFSISDIPWESSFEAAKARARLEHKPILLLHVFGRLDQEFTWTNARTLRAVTLSNPEVIKFLSNEVVPYWESVGPVPKVTIELGDGRVIKRTLGGNIVTYLLSPRGDVYDAFPGVYTPEDYLAEIHKTIDAIKNGPDLLSWHRQELTAAEKTEEMRMTMSKAVVESPLLNALGKGRSLQAVAKDSATAFQDYTARLQDISKQAASVSELRSSVLKDMRSNDPEKLGRAAVEIDSANNLKLIRPAVHLLFSSYKKLPSIQQCRDQVYEDILHVPIHDPYLGLADAIVPGSPIQ